MSVKLLIAEDEENIRAGMARYLRSHSDRFSTIYEAANGQEAIDLMLQHHPDLMLLDMQMPIKNGVDVMKAADAAGLQPLTVVLSGHDEFRYAQQALKYGAREYLLKPVRASDILSCLNRLADKYLETEPAPEEAAPTGQSNIFVKKAKEYIAEHYAENLSLTSVAEEIGISGGYLSTMFTQYLGCGFVDYLNGVRVERACCYLDQDLYKTYDIATKVGFRDEKYFYKVFKKCKGMTPREYRTRADKENL